MGTHEMNARRVAEMSLQEAIDLRDRLDNTPSVDLPGAWKVGPVRALRAYSLFRALLTAKIDVSNG